LSGPENKIKDYYEGLQRVIKLYTACWLNKEGRFEAVISDDKGSVEWTLKGGPTERSQRLRGDNE